MKKLFSLIALLGLSVSLAGCAAPLTGRGTEHKAAIEKIVAQVKDFGFGKGSIEKDCAVAFDCSANDQYHFIAMLNDKDFNSDEALCQNLFSLGEKVGIKKWRRDLHETEESYDQTNFTDGFKVCKESLAVNEGEGNASQSEGVIIFGAVPSDGNPVMVQIQVNSVNKPEFAPDSARGYFFSIQTTEG